MRMTTRVIYTMLLFTAFGCKIADDNNTSGAKDASARPNCEPPMDARGEGLCEEVLGYKWDGDKCEPIAGCKCVGDDCGHIFDGKHECQVTNYLCLELSLCGGPDNLVCTSNEYCEGGGENVYSGEWFATGCGEMGSLGICRQRPKKCPEENDTSTPTPCCGCDGNYYESYCEAHLAGTNIAYATNDDTC